MIVKACKQAIVSRNVKYVLISVSMFLLASTILASPLFRVIESGENFTEIEFRLDSFDIEEVDVAGTEYKRLSHPLSGYLMKEGLPELLSFSVILAIPPQGTVEVANYKIKNREVLTDILVFPSQGFDLEICPETGFRKNEDFYSSDLNYPEKSVTLNQPAIMRHQRLISLTINPFSYNPSSQELKVFDNVTVRVEYNLGVQGENEIAVNNHRISRVFDSFLQETVLNYDQYRVRNPEYQDRSLLVLYHHSPTILPSVNQYLSWKRDKGFEIDAVSTQNLSSNVAIKNYIQNAYNNSANPPEHVVIIGGTTGALTVPYWSGGGDSDHPYALLAGDDDLMDVFLGRVWIENSSQMATFWNKVKNYEKTPYLDETDWYQHNLLVGDPSTSGVSTIITNRYIKEIMYRHNNDYTFAEVYESPFASQMNTALNQGVSFFNFRGFAGVGGWSPNESLLYNGLKLSNSVILTCGTLSYIGSNTVNNIFKMGTPTVAKGSISGIGMTTSSTRTAFNNCIGGGIFYGIFVENMRTMGEALARGKLNLWQSYGSSFPSYAEVFSRWVNLIGDPSVDIWVEEPKVLNVSHEAVLSPGSNSIMFTATDESGLPVEDVWITIRQGNDVVFATGYTDTNGSITHYFEPDAVGEIKATATKPNYIPYLGTFELAGTAAVSYHSSVINGDVIAGNTIDLIIFAENHQLETVYGVSGVLSTESDYIQIIDNTSDFGDIDAEEVVESLSSFSMSIAADTPAGYEAQIDLTLTSSNQDNWVSRFVLNVQNGMLLIDDIEISDGANGILDPGEQATLIVHLINSGTVTLQGVSGTLSGESFGFTIVDDSAYFGDIMPGQTVASIGDNFIAATAENVIPGMSFALNLQLYNDDGFFQNSLLRITVGEVTVDDPLGPDAYGYWVYDIGDSAYVNAPEYDWIEIAPQLGGNGVNTGLQSDFNNNQQVINMDLPFDFRFYGIDYSTISICGNGWMSFGITEQASQRNWHIPGPLGPSSIVAAFWDNLSLDQGGVYTYYDQAENIFVIQWQNATNIVQDLEETFQIILYDPASYFTQTGDGLIKIQYKVFNNVNSSGGSPHGEWGNFSTIGIADETCTRGLEYTFNNEYPTAARQLTDESALLFVPSWLDSFNPSVVLESFTVNDGNNGVPEYGETITFDLTFSNNGDELAESVSAVLYTENPYISIVESDEYIGDIPVSGTTTISDAFSISIAQDIPHLQSVNFVIALTSASGMNWSSGFQIEVTAPNLVIDSFDVMDGNNNVPQNGELINVAIDLHNTGGSAANDISALLYTEDEYAVIVDNVVSFGYIPIDGIISGDSAFTVQLAENAPHLHDIDFVLNIAIDGNYVWSDEFDLTVQSPDIELEEFYVTDDNNNIPEYGELINIQLNLANSGGNIAEGVTAVLSSEDQYIEIIDNELFFANIPAGTGGVIDNGFTVEIADNIPDMHRVNFDLAVTTTTNHIWYSDFYIDIQAPELTVLNPLIYDPEPGGNNNGLIDPGETLSMYLPIKNIGSATTAEISIEINSVDPMATITEVPEILFEALYSGDTAYALVMLEVNEDVEIGTSLFFTYSLEAGNYSFSGQVFSTVVGLTGHVGEGTATNSTSAASPINIFYRSLRGQTVYTADELNAAGLGLIGGGTIQQFGYFVASPPTHPLPNFVIRMKHTTAANSSVHDNGPFVTVYESDSYSPTAGGWDMLNLSTPFVWNGVDNILVDTAFSQTASFNSSGQLRIYSVPNGYRFSRSDANDQTNAVTTNVSSDKPQALFQFEANPEILRPDNLNAILDNDNVYLQWDSPQSERDLGNRSENSNRLNVRDTLNRDYRDPDGYNVYRNGTIINDQLVTTEEFWDNQIDTSIAYYYYVTAVFNGVESPSSNLVYVEFGDMTLPPSFSPSPGYYNSTTFVSLSSMTAGASIYYTTDGSDPTESSALYTAPIELTLDSETTINAKAYSDDLLPSLTVSGTYYLSNTIPAPSIEPESGIYSHPVEITLSLPGPNWNIYYTLDGTDPTEESHHYTTSFMLPYSAVVKARAFAAGWNPSDIVSSTFTVLGIPQNFTASAQDFDITLTWNSPPSPLTVNRGDRIVALDLVSERALIGNSASEERLFVRDRQELLSYRIYRGFNSENNMVFLTEVPLTNHSYVDSDLTAGTYYYKIKAVYTEGESDFTTTLSAQVPKVGKPAISPREGDYYEPQLVNINCPTPNTTIYYTLDGSEPTTSSILYDGPFELSFHALVRARAFRNDWVDSDIASVQYYLILPPSGLTGDTGPGSVHLTWETPGSSDRAGSISAKANRNSSERSVSALQSKKRDIFHDTRDVIGYNIYRANTGEDFAQINDEPVTALEYLDTDLATAEYEYYVKTLDTNGESLPSETIVLSVTGVVSDPEFLPEPGEYSDPVSITLSCFPAEAQIFYTLDGSDPDENSLVYDGDGIFIDQTTTVKAIGMLDEWYNSEIVAAVYTIGLSADGEEEFSVLKTELFSAYPNPFNPQTTISFNLRESGLVSIEIYNIAGKRVCRLVETILPSGRHSYVWHGTDDKGRQQSSGIYLYRLKTTEQSFTRRMILLK